MHNSWTDWTDFMRHVELQSRGVPQTVSFTHYHSGTGDNDLLHENKNITKPLKTKPKY